MATRKSTKKTTSTRKKKNIKFNLHKPGELPEENSVANGTTLGELIETYSLDGYVVSVNGSSESKDYTLIDGDTIRIGIKTKNN